jgi:tetratricopeptide (TPR) repeat protein
MEDLRMKIRYGLVLLLALVIGAAGCAAGGGGGGGAAASAGPVVPGGEVLLQGERPRQTDFTRAAQRALDDGDDEDDPNAARAFYQQALAGSMNAITEDGRNPLAHRLAALSNLGLEDYQAAGEHFDHASELRPIYEFEDARIREGVWIDLYQAATPLVNAQDYEAAVPFFENAHAMYDGRPEAMITLGQIYAQTGEFEKSADFIDMALEMLDSPEAVEQGEEVLAGWRELAAPLPMLKAQVLAQSGRHEEAVSAYRVLLEAEPGNTVAMRDLASMLIQTGDEDAAYSVYDDLLALPSLTGPDLYSIGVGFYQGSAYDRAAATFRRAAEQNQYDRDAVELWARSLALDEAFEAVPQAADHWVRLDPSSQTAHLILAQAVNANGDTERTGEVVRQMEALEVDVTNLSLRRFEGGGGEIRGSMTNKTHAAGTAITITFTFYSDSASPLGTSRASVTMGETDMAELFVLEFDSTEEVGGYTYEITGG